MSATPIIEIKSLCKNFGNFTAVDNLNITVLKGDIYGFLGPNGAGKSTTIRMLLSLIKPTSGSIQLFGSTLANNRKDILKKVGAIVEKPDFYLYLSARKNLEILGKMSGHDIPAKTIDSILDLVGLLDRAESKVKTYSYGMKQRLGIAQALIHDPELIILDEPTNGLDPVGVKEVRDLILYLQKEKNKTIFLSSHILPEVELIANRMVIINNGKEVIEGSVKELLNNGLLTVSFRVDNPDKAKESLLDTRYNSHIYAQEHSTIIMNIDQMMVKEIAAHLVHSGIGIEEITTKRSLEDYFLSITQP